MPARVMTEREGDAAGGDEVKFEELFNDRDDAFADERKKKVGGYILGRTLGEGSFAKVRQGVHVVTNEKVAVKVINKRMIMKREYVRKNMRREAVMMQRLAHPNIVPLIEVMETENSFYMVMQYAEGGDFMKYLTDRNNLSESETRKFMRQIVSAVDHMHRSGVVHRDLKIENLLLDADCNMKLIDFGLSNHWDGETLLATQCGSPAYAAPEIFSKRNYGPEVDVWSIGINMFAMLTGRLPFLVDPPNNLQKLHSLILRGASIPDYLSSDCQDLLSRLLEPQEGARITLEEVMTHPWINDGCMPLDQWGLKVKPMPNEINTEVIWYMVEHLQYAEDSIRDSVINFKPNATTGNYFILCQRLRKGNGFPNGVKYPSTQRAHHHSQQLNNKHLRKAMHSSKHSLTKENTSTTLQSSVQLDSKRNAHAQRAPLSVRDQNHAHAPAAVGHGDSHRDAQTYNQYAAAPAATQNGHVMNGYPDSGHVMNGYAESGQHTNDQHTPQMTNDYDDNVDMTTIDAYTDEHRAIAHVRAGNEQTLVTSSPHHQQVMGNMLQSQQRPAQYGSHQNMPTMQREKAGSVMSVGGRETPVNQQLFDIRDVHTVGGELSKRTSLPDIPHEVGSIGLTPRNVYRDTMKLNTKKRRPKKEKTLYRQDKSSSVPDHLNVLGATYKHRPGQLADSLALRNTRYKLRYNSKPEDMNRIGKYSNSKPEDMNRIGKYSNSKPEDMNRIGKYSNSKPEGLNYSGGGAYHPQQPPHCTIEPGTVLQGTHQLTPSEQAQLDKLKAKELLKKQVVNGYDYPDAPPQTPRRYGYVATGGAGHGSKMTVRERTRHFEVANVSLENGERDRHGLMMTDARTSHASRAAPAAYSRDQGGNHISNVGYYTIPAGHGARARGSNSPTRSTAAVADPTKYQSPFVRRDAKRISGRSKELYQELVAPTRRTHAALVATPR